LSIEPCEFVTICPKYLENMPENFVNLLTLKCDETIKKCAQKIENVHKI
jgi:hypothetical protein